jgi:cysteine-rich repeat protein
VEPGEQCDLGAGNGPGTGCELDCTFSCSTAKPCTTTDVCKGTSTCTTLADGGAQKCVAGAPPTPGTMCGSGDAGAAGKCQLTDAGEICITGQCGDGIVESGEQCDFGAGNNVAGSGCDPDCQFSCQMATPNSCQSNLCAANPTTCTAVTGPNQSGGQKCQPATEVAACGDCSPTGVCKNNACATSVCGDGCVDSRINETCDPPNGTTCDSQCHTITAAVCGNGTRETGEQCDDGNKVNLDGCDSTCQFEQVQRANSLSIEYSTSTFCPNNALGLAIGSGLIAGLAQSTVTDDLTSSVNAGTTSIQWKFMGITDVTGTSQSSGLSIGTFSAAPAAAPTGVTYDGGSDLDWWYTTAGSTVDGNRNPTSLTQATFASAVLSAMNGSMNVTISLAGQASTLALTDVSIQAHIGGVSAPTESASGNTPGHLPTENLDPKLKSFGSMNNGVLCGNISAQSLSTVPVPSTLESGVAACGNVTFGAMNHLLDVFIVGCTKGVAGGVITATQPDQLTPSAPAGAKFKFTADPTTHEVTGCTNNGVATPLATCLAGAAYSGYFGFTSDRVIAK